MPWTARRRRVDNFALFAALDESWGGCVEMRPTPYDAEDTAASTGTPGSMFVPMFAPDAPDNWTCSTGSCTYVGSSNSTRRYTGAPTGSQSYNNYLPDAGTPSACGSAATVTIANPAVVTLANHGLSAGDRVMFSTTGSLPRGLTPRRPTMFCRPVLPPTASASRPRAAARR